MANTFTPNQITDLMAVRAAESGAYLTVGSRPYFKDQLNKANGRNGQKVDLVITDAGEYFEGTDGTGHLSNLTERNVTKTLKLGNIMINTDMVESVTDVDWDKEIVRPNLKKLINGIVKTQVKEDIGHCNAAFIGKGWLPLSKASRFLSSVSSDSKYAFVDPMIDSVMAAGGKAFTPVEADNLYKKGMLGSFSGTEFRETPFLPQLIVSSALATEIASATVTSYTDNNDDTATIVLNGVTEDIPVGFPIMLQDVYATDTVGDKTSALKAFIAIDKGTAGSVKVYSVDFAGQGTKQLCAVDGSALSASGLAGKKLVAVPAGTYYMGLFRVDGAMAFCTLDKLRWATPEKRSENVEGIYVHEGASGDVIKGEAVTRWAIASLAGIVEDRACAMVYVAESTPNVVSVL